MGEQRNRDLSAPRVARYAEPAASKQYGVEVCAKSYKIRRACSEGSLQVRDLFREKWTSGYDWIYLFPTLCCCVAIISHIFTWTCTCVPLSPLFVGLYNLLIVLVLSVV